MGIRDSFLFSGAKVDFEYNLSSVLNIICRSPLELPNLDSGVIRHIDNFLAEENSELREESLLKLFWKVRSRARSAPRFVKNYK